MFRFWILNNAFANNFLKLLNVNDDRSLPNERLGCSLHGIKAIKKNKWFDGFNWEGLKNRTISVPHQPKVTEPAMVNYFR